MDQGKIDDIANEWSVLVGRSQIRRLDVTNQRRRSMYGAHVEPEATRFTGRHANILVTEKAAQAHMLFLSQSSSKSGKDAAERLFRAEGIQAFMERGYLMARAAFRSLEVGISSAVRELEFEDSWLLP